MKAYLAAAKYVHEHGADGEHTMFVCNTLERLFNSPQLVNDFNNVFNPYTGYIAYFSTQAVSGQAPTYIPTKESNEHRIMALLLMHEIERTGGL